MLAFFMVAAMLNFFPTAVKTWREEAAAATNERRKVATEGGEKGRHTHRVPNLELDGLAVDGDHPGPELDADGEVVDGLEALVGELQQQAQLANACLLRRVTGSSGQAERKPVSDR